MKLTPVIGLEIHIQLKTQSKMFCGDDNSGENQPVNTTISPISLAHPGTLPVPNRKAIEWTIKAGLALNCDIPATFEFERKNYFYPDLPKGYQITSSTKPPCIGGHLDIVVNKEPKTIRLHHIHLEEDAAKNTHSADGKHTLVDYNRGGTPLMEMVTEADMRTPAEAKIFLQELRLMMRHLEISDADMEKGHLRCDANISLTDELNDDGTVKKYYPKTEVKNINSFRSVERALEYEIKRQTKLWNEGTPPTESTTRGWNEAKAITEQQRVKEELHDYRYFPEPDIPPINLQATDGINVLSIKNELPELPQAKRQRLMNEYNISEENALVITDDKGLANFFEQVMSELRAWLLAHGELEGTDEEVWDTYKGKLAQKASNWLTNKLMTILAKDGRDVVSCAEITAENFAEFITLVHQSKVNSTIAMQLLEMMATSGKDPSVILEEEDLSGGTDEGELSEIIDQIITQNPDQVTQYKAGKETLIQFFVGQVMRQTKGKADPEQTKNLIESKLK